MILLHALIYSNTIIIAVCLNCGSTVSIDLGLWSYCVRCCINTQEIVAPSPKSLCSSKHGERSGCALSVVVADNSPSLQNVMCTA